MMQLQVVSLLINGIELIKSPIEFLKF